LKLLPITLKNARLAFLRKFYATCGGLFLINPLMSIITLGVRVLDLSTIRRAHPNSVLASLATTAAGPNFGHWIAFDEIFDAFLVLSGV
jgi:hypothetical protein